MISYDEQLAALHRAVIHQQPANMLGFIKPARHNTFTPEMRLGIYTNGYEIRLFDAIEMDYPQTRHYLGDALFEESAMAFIHATPSRFWDLNLYSIAYADFLKSYSDDVFLQDIAAFESALIDVYWLPESEAWVPTPELTPEALLRMPLQLRTTARLLALRYPVADYEINTERKPEAADTYYLVLRHRGAVQHHLLEAAEYLALQQDTFGAAMDHVTTPEQAQSWLARWIAEGFLT